MAIIEPLHHPLPAFLTADPYLLFIATLVIKQLDTEQYIVEANQNHQVFVIDLHAEQLFVVGGIQYSDDGWRRAGADAGEVKSSAHKHHS